MYNEFDPKHYKGKWPCTIKTLYNEKTLIGRLHQYFLIYFETFSVPTADTLFLLILSILTLESAHSIRFLYQHFLSGITEKSLNVFYYACSYAKVDYSRFMNTTVRIVLKLIPDSLQTQPVFLCVDDTMVSKFGTKFENVSKLFDHAAHNGSNYLNGHCFVRVMLCLNFTAKIMSSSLVTAGIQNTTCYPSLMNIRIRIWLAMQGVLLSCMILLMSIFLFVKFLKIFWWNGSIIRRM